MVFVMSTTWRAGAVAPAATALTVSKPPVTTYVGDRVTLSGRLTTGPGLHIAGGTPLEVQAIQNGTTSWKPLASIHTDAKGYYVFSFSPVGDRTYQVTYAGGTSDDHRPLAGTRSPKVRVDPVPMKYVINDRNLSASPVPLDSMVTLSGTLLNVRGIRMAGQSVSVWLNKFGRWYHLADTRTSASGAFSATVKMAGVGYFQVHYESLHASYLPTVAVPPGPLVASTDRAGTVHFTESVPPDGQGAGYQLQKATSQGWLTVGQFDASNSNVGQFDIDDYVMRGGTFSYRAILKADPLVARVVVDPVRVTVTPMQWVLDPQLTPDLVRQVNSWRKGNNLPPLADGTGLEDHPIRETVEQNADDWGDARFPPPNDTDALFTPTVPGMAWDIDSGHEYVTSPTLLNQPEKSVLNPKAHYIVCAAVFAKWNWDYTMAGCDVF